MAKQLRLRISKVLPSFSSCRSFKSRAIPPTTDDDCQLHLSPPIPCPPPPTPPRVQVLQHRRGQVPVVTSSGCICRSFSRSVLPKSRTPAASVAGFQLADVPSAEVIPAYLWRKENEWHVVVNPEQQMSNRRKIDSDDGNDLFPPLAIPRPSYRKSKSDIRTRKGTKKNKKKKREARSGTYRVSTSSADSLLFSTDGDKEYEEDYVDFEGHEAETLICTSNSFSTDGEQMKRRRRRRRCSKSPDTTESSPGRPSMSSLLLRRLRWMSSFRPVERKVRESVAVVKRSEDPYEDFRRSIMEMVLKKQIYEAAELEQLLHCFLSLNSGEHHRAILMAFSDVLGALPTSDDSPGVLSRI